jgi:DnaJ-class molecular chaperone
MDHYKTLDVARTATPDEIKKAYRKLASQHHPDKGGNTVKFQELQTAYDTLSDPAQRAEYDNPRPQFSGFPGGGFNMHDIFGQMFGQQSGQTSRRNHVRMTVWITLLDVAQGGSRTVNVGTSTGSSTVQIEIPKGINDGDNVQYSGVGPGGVDLIVQFRVRPDARWRREDLNLYCEHRVPIWDLILGVETEVINILGHQLVVGVPQGTQPGTTMRLKGHGLQDRHGQTGDLMLRVQGEIPKTIAPEIVAAIQQYQK